MFKRPRQRLKPVCEYSNEFCGWPWEMIAEYS